MKNKQIHRNEQGLHTHTHTHTHTGATGRQKQNRHPTTHTHTGVLVPEAAFSTTLNSRRAKLMSHKQAEELGNQLVDLAPYMVLLLLLLLLLSISLYLSLSIYLPTYLPTSVSLCLSLSLSASLLVSFACLDSFFSFVLVLLLLFVA